jgi:NADH-quinone oxidoreductase subunit H
MGKPGIRSAFRYAPPSPFGCAPRASLQYRSMQITLPAQLLVSTVTLLVVLNTALLTIAALIYLERKISAWIQDRIGPNRTGFDFGIPALAPLKGKFGLGQSIADGLKFLLKEDYCPDKADKILFTLAPMMIIVPALIGIAIIPWGGAWTIADFTILGIHIEGGTVQVAGAAINAGVIYLLAVASIGVYGITIGGWASNNKYSFLGGLRATAQMISYELPLGLALLAVLLLTGSLIPGEIVAHQVEHGWLVFAQPIAAFIFFAAMLAEANRAPFDNAEAEQELVGGYHTEYSSMRFAMFFLAEYSHLITSSAFFTLLFLGGWDAVPFLGLLPIESAGIGLVLVKAAIYFGKVFALICFIMVVRWTLPRIRYDQVMMMAWQAIIPLGLIVVVGTSVMVYFRLTGVVPMLLGNVVVLALILAVQPSLPRANVNRRVQLIGSRFNPTPDERVRTAPSDPLALEDRPIEGTSRA